MIKDIGVLDLNKMVYSYMPRVLLAINARQTHSIWQRKISLVVSAAFAWALLINAFPPIGIEMM